MNRAIASAAFDPEVPGHSNSSWNSLLSGVPEWEPAPGPLIVVSPHPDDEVLGAGGLIHDWTARGQPVTVVSVTDGEAAHPIRRNLGSLRRIELGAALRKLSALHVSVLRLAIPDGRVCQFQNRLRNAISSLLSHDATLVAPYEHDGHCDHDAVGRVCCGLAHDTAVPLVRYPIWRWHHGDRAPLRKARWAKFPLSAEARRAKARAVRCFESQLAPEHSAPIIPAHVLTYFERSFEAFLL